MFKGFAALERALSQLMGRDHTRAFSGVSEAMVRSDGLHNQLSWWRFATRADVIQRSCKVSLVVGTVLAFINHRDKILELSVQMGEITRISLTYFIPYCVTTWASVQSLRSGRLDAGESSRLG